MRNQPTTRRREGKENVKKENAKEKITEKEECVPHTRTRLQRRIRFLPLTESDAEPRTSRRPPQHPPTVTAFVLPLIGTRTQSGDVCSDDIAPSDDDETSGGDGMSLTFSDQANQNLT